MKRTPARLEDVRCPMCFSPGHISEKYFVDWHEQKKEFQVSMALYCWPCRYRWNETFLKALPLVIAQQSRCSCGATLTLANFSITRVDDEIEFKGLYVCDRCSAKEESFSGQLLEAVQALWRSTKKLEIGPTGIKFEKDSQSTTKEK